MLYRDLKAENVLIGDDGYLLLADFGLAKRLQNESEVTHTFCGTPDYMAPEMVGPVFNNPETYGMVVDWWAVGVLVYEMIMG